MTTPKRIDRKSFLVACASVTLGACSGDPDTQSPDGSGGAGMGGGNTGGTGGTGASTGGTAMAGAGTGGTSGGGTGGNAMGGAGTGGNAMGGAGTAGTSGAGTGGMSGGGGGGGTLTCTTETDNGNHSHELLVPASDVERGYQDKGVPYILEDGGMGHMHTLTMTDYEFLYLQADGTFTKTSSMEAGHAHECVITCTEE
jgi:hypothetical protein